MDDRIDREREFHDHSYADGARERVGRFYAAAGGAVRGYRRSVEKAGRDADVLEFGCGPGGVVGYLKSTARSLVGIDVSPVAIEMARDWASGVAGDAPVRFETMNAEAMTFEDASFDLVCGSGILHHLDLEAGLVEVRRVLRPGGTGVFFEPMGHNPLIEWYRRRTPEMRSDDEHPLKMQDLKTIRAAFPDTRVRFHALTTLAIVPLTRWSWSKWLMRAGEAVDSVLLRIPGVRRLAWIVVVEVRG